MQQRGGISAIVQVTPALQVVSGTSAPEPGLGEIGLMDKILHYLKDPKLWELWYIPYYGSCRILSINRRVWGLGPRGL